MLVVWSEVWAMLIPLIIVFIFKPKGKYIQLVVAYVILGFILNFCAIFTLVYPNLVPHFLVYNNNVFYNVHSFLMVILLGTYIVIIKPYKYKLILKGLIILYVGFSLIDFIFFENPLLYSTRHFTISCVILLLLSLVYFLSLATDNSNENWINHPSFIFCTAICFYNGITFFIFLFFSPMYDSTYNKDVSFALLMMKIIQAAFVIFCILLALGFYKARNLKNKVAA